MNSSSSSDKPHTPALDRALGPVMLWGLGVGYVISGEYFGWNLGLVEGGTYGLFAAFVLITTMYVAFVFSYTEMACAIPRAGGVFVYGVRGLGLTAGYLGGIAQVVEFVFAPPAIAVAIGGYAQLWIHAPLREQIAAALPWGLDAGHLIAAVAYVLFTALNVWGVRQAALFELAVTVLAVGELLLFTCVAAPHFAWSNFAANALPNGWWGVLPAIPFAIWFYLAIEGVANAAEEAKNPQRDVARGFGSAMLTLVVLAGCVLVCGIGVGGWERIVYKAGDVTIAADGATLIAKGAESQDTPLPLALAQIVTPGNWLYRILIGIGLLGLIASFNGIILVAGRALFEMGRVGFLPHFVGRANATTKTPINALVLNLVVGIVAVLFLDTGGLITMSALGAVTLYIVSMLALMRLRIREPDLPRPYRTPWYPVLPLVTLAIATFALLTMLYLNMNLEVGAAWLHGEATLGKFLRGAITLWYVAFIAGAFVYYFAFVRSRLEWDDIAHFHRLD